MIYNLRDKINHCRNIITTQDQSNNFYKYIGLIKFFQISKCDFEI